VVHGEHRVGLLEPLRHEQRVGGNRARRIDCLLLGLGDRRRDDFQVFPAEVARFAAVRIEARDQDARLRIRTARAGRDRGPRGLRSGRA
jgi:hypothetical protein